jgi:hypothetical protein
MAASTPLGYCRIVLERAPDTPTRRSARQKPPSGASLGVFLWQARAGPAPRELAALQTAVLISAHERERKRRSDQEAGPAVNISQSRGETSGATRSPR